MEKIEKTVNQSSKKTALSKEGRILIYTGVAIIFGLLFYLNYERFIVSEIPQGELDKITGRAGFDSYCKGLNVSLHNGSNWRIKELILTVEVKEKNGSVRWKRQYKTDTEIPPQSDKVIFIKMVDIDNVGSHSWSIYDGKGISNADLRHTITYVNNKFKQPRDLTSGFNYKLALKDALTQGMTEEEANLEIAKYLSEKNNLDFDRAIEEGYSHREIIEFLADLHQEGK